MYDEKEISQVSIVFAALSNPARLKILSIITETKKPLHIKAVAITLKMDYAAVYRYIAVLKKANLLQIFEVGRSRVLSPLHVEGVEQLVQQAIIVAK
ncbi:winged helix-turn-helix transcriptional regulator [Candidatus Bathyarchaeota archaeon]|nr:winged helix-turn-helix transcriptional regulator [Candidatus Bathyarchaeota archaeon]